jgi:hypothetical protein
LVYLQLFIDMYGLLFWVMLVPMHVKC